MADNQQYGPLAPKQNSASDIRSVIANATKTSGKGMTIATKDELNQKKVSNTNGLSNKNIVSPTTASKVNPNIAKVNNTKPTSVAPTTKTEQAPQQQGTKMSSLIQGQVSGDLFKNPAVQPINNVKVEQINGKNQNLSDSYVNYHLDKNEIKNMLVETPEEKKKRQSEGVEKLYIDAYRKKKDGGVLTVEDVLGNANYQRELNGIEQGVLQEMVNDANTLANAGKFNMDNAMALFDKYQDLGIQIDYNKLSPESKAQFVGDMLNNKQSTLGKIISWATPMGQISNIKELITGKSMTDDILDTITKLEESSHKNLTDKDTDKIASKQIKKLDEAYKDFYDMGKKAPSLIDYATNIKNVGDLYYKHKYGVDEDQKIWKDKDKEKEYNEELNKIRSAIKEQHGDTAANVARNTLIGSAKALLTVANMASDLPSFGKMIWDLGKGGVEDFVGGVATVGKTAYDTAKYAKDTGDFEVQWDAKDIRQRVAEAGGYDNYNDFVAKVEQELGGSPLGQFLAWSLKDADTSMNTANALGNYFIEKYGTLDDGLTAFKNDPVEATSDWIPWGQFNVKLLEKLGLISSAKANKIIEASRWMDAYDKPFELVNKFQFGPLLKMEGKLLGGVSKLGLGTINLPFKLVSRAVDAVFSKLTGIDKESRNFIRENPDEVLSYVNGEKTSDGILRDIKDKFDEITDEKRQIGEEYNVIKESDTPIKSKGIMDDIYSKLSEYEIKLNTDGSVEFSRTIPSSIKGKVNELVSYINDFQKKGDTPSASDTHYFRQLVDNLTNWDNPNLKGLDAQFDNTLKGIRRTIDSALKEQVPGMKEADAAYSAALDTIKELRRDWFDKDGTLKDSAYSRIRNLTNKGSNQPKLERLESVIPGITKKLKSLAVSEVIERGMKQATGQHLNQIVGGVGIGALASLFTGGVSLPTLITGALGMMYATPENFAHLLRFEGKVTKPIRDIANKISNRTKLTAKETSNLVDFMLDNQERLGKTAQYMYEKGLLEEPMKASDIKAPKSKDPTLKELTDYKESLKKALKEGKISQKYYDDEIHGKNGEPGIDYAIAQKKARTKIGDKEKVLSAEDKERVTNFIKKRANDVGFVTKMFEHLPYDEGFTILREKLIAFSKNPGNTTSQHELFHAFFSVCDNKTKTYLIQEARKILKDNGMAIKDAEEWLAESFGIYAKRKMIDLGMIKNAPKGFVDKLRNFFQKVYEYMQRFNGDRATINKLFDEVLGEKQMKDGIMDLSDLLGDKKLDKKLLREIELGDNGLRNKSVYHGSPADFDKFDSSHMGEGEGAQAHGWGHYVAVEKNTGKRYANMGGAKIEYKGKPLDGDITYRANSVEDRVANRVYQKLNKGTKFDKALSELKEEARDWINYYEKKLRENESAKHGFAPDYSELDLERIEQLKQQREDLKMLDKMKESDFVNKKGRNLYNLEIPDPKKADTPTGSNYLEESGKLTDSELNKFKEIFKDSGIKMLSEKFDDFGVKMMDYSGKKGRTLYKFLERALGSDKEASKFLESLGYDGIHYFGGRDGEAYVIFNDDALQIKDHIRYKKKIGNKDVEINKDITSPNKMVKINDKGYSVIKQFISEKQAEKALDVSKELLDNKGNPYMWTHTNKYNSEQFANFINTKDSKYKEFTDNEIAWFTNNEDMSRSYGNWDSILANTKPYKSVSEFNNKNTKVEKSSGEQTTRTGIKIPTESENTIGTKIIEKDGKYNVVQVNEGKFTLDTTLDKLLDDMGIAKEGYMPDNETKHTLSREERIERVKWEFAGSYSWGKWDVDIKELPNGKVEVTRNWNKTLGKYDSEKAALAEYTASKTGKSKYHYQGIIQNIKNPLVVDIKGEGDNLSFWNRLGNAYDFLKKTDGEGLKKIEKADKIYNETVQKYVDERKSLDNEAREIKIRYWEETKKATEPLHNPKLTGEEREKILKDSEELSKNYSRVVSAQQGINKLLNGYSDDLRPGVLEWVNNNKDYSKLYSKVKKFLSDNKEMRSMIDRPTANGMIDFLKKNGVDDATAGLLHGMWVRNVDGFNFIEELKRKELQTNDYVFYALKKGGYDGVLFKGITDYGHEPKGGWGMAEAGDVLAAFKSSDFKAWDNANPTDSKYISYKKKVSLDKKSEGLQKKDSSGLLAKGRDRTLGNDGLRYKTNISEKDSSGKKLSEGQKKFFAGSKVVDKDGNLLRVYHGTVAGDFTVFQKYGNRTSNNVASDVGFWFTPSKKGAINFAKESSWRGDNKARAEEVYLDIKNPKVYEPSEFNLKDYEERDKLIDSKYKEVYAARNEMNKYDYNHFWMGEYTHENHVNRGIFNKLEYIYNQKGKITEADLKDIKEEYGKINWNGYYKPEIDATYEDFKNYLQAKKKYDKLNDEYLEMKHSDSYDDFKADIYKLDNKKRDKLDFALDDMDAAKKYIDNLKKEGYDGIIIKGTEYDGTTLGEGARNDQYVAFDSNQIKRITNENPTKNEDIRFKKAYHGSPYEFNKFDSSHMGEGEGAQAHGWGHYVALDKKTAENYAGLRKRMNEFTYKGKEWNRMIADGSAIQVPQLNDLVHEMQGYDIGFDEAKQRRLDYLKKDIKEMTEWLKRDDLKEMHNTYRRLIEKDKQGIKDLEKIKKSDFEGIDRNLYELDIPDPVKKDTPTGKNYLDEGKIIRKGQVDKFLNVAKEKLKSDEYNKLKDYIDRWNINGGMITEDLYSALDNSLGGQKQASKFLESLGYDGIHYFGGQDGEAYVLFNDNSPKIKNSIRYKKGLTAKDQTQTPEFKKWFEGSKVVDKSGKPLVMYHGTERGGFNVFDASVDRPWKKDRQGFYFSADKNYSKTFQGINKKTGKYYDSVQERIDKGNANPQMYKVYLDIKNPLILKPEDVDIIEDIGYWDKIYDSVKEQGYDGVMMEDKSQAFVFSPNQIKSATDNIGTFDKNNPDIRYKKGLQKKENGLEKKKTSTASSFQGRVDAIANELGVKGGNTVQKMKRINKIIKEDKYKGTDVKKRFYQLKWEYKKQYIINNDKKIKDKGFKRTTIRVWQNGKKADWHFTKKQYDELKELGYIVE